MTDESDGTDGNGDHESDGADGNGDHESDGADGNGDHESDGADGNEDYDGPAFVGIALRLVLANVALLVGLAWLVRLLRAGPGIADGLLFELLPPALILYLGMRYFRRQFENIQAFRRQREEG